MSKSFRPRVIEPGNSRTPNGVSIAVEIEFDEKIAGLQGDTLVFYLADDATHEDGEKLRNVFRDMVAKIAVTRPKVTSE